MLITTKFLGPTNTKGGRVKATSGSGKTATIGWNSSGDIDDNHITAAETLAAKMAEDGGRVPKLWVRRWNKDGTCVHIGIYEGELD